MSPQYPEFVSRYIALGIVLLEYDGLCALKMKYEELIILRSEREIWEKSGLLTTPQENLKERQASAKRLAGRFPGVLRQLECLSAKDLQK